MTQTREQAKTGDTADERQESGGDSTSQQRHSLPERVTLFLSVAVVLGLIGYIGWHGLFVAKGPPMIEPRVLVKKAVERGGQWLVPIEVKNLSDLPLEEVNVAVEMMTREGEKTEITLTSPYLPERGSEEMIVVSELPPAQAKLRATVESFKAQRSSSGY